jgi:hypothetical protein
VPCIPVAGVYHAYGSVVKGGWLEWVRRIQIYYLKYCIIVICIKCVNSLIRSLIISCYLMVRSDFLNCLAVYLCLPSLLFPWCSLPVRVCVCVRCLICVQNIAYLFSVAYCVDMFTVSHVESSSGMAWYGMVWNGMVSIFWEF